MLRLQVCRHRLRSGFASDDVRLAGKTGNLLTLRREIGVVELPDGTRYAVSMFTRAGSAALTNPAAETVIGPVTRLVMDQLHHATRTSQEAPCSYPSSPRCSSAATPSRSG